jgi:CheY-like chemotaxis protein
MKKVRQVLIVDDDAVSRHIMADAAKQLYLEASIITCSSAFSALSHIREYCMPTLDNWDIYCPELLLIDITMPVIDGYGFLAELYQMEGLRHNNTSALIVSNHSYDNERHKAQLFPILGYVEKPLTVENLAFALKNVLPKRE